MLQLPSNPVIGPMPLTPEWYALRKYDPKRNPPVVLGASIAAAVCGLSPYKMALEVFMYQRGMLEDQEVTAAMQNGLDFEPVVIKRWARERGYQVETGLPMYLSRQWPWMAATPDAIALTTPLRGGDAKVTSFRRYDAFGLDPNAYGEEETDQLPIDNIMQAQQQMAVLGLDVIEFPVMFDIYTQRIYVVHREQSLIDMIVAAGEEMVERIINNDPPEPDFKHPKAVKIVRELHGLTVGKTVELDEETVAGWNQLSHIKQQINDLDKQASELRAIVLHQLQDAQFGTFPRGTKQIKRSVIADTYWSADDLKEIEAKIGQVKRRGHERLLETKVK